MSYTNQKTFWSLQVTLGLLTSTRDQIYFSDTSQYQCAIPTITQYQCTRLSVTPAKHTPKQYHSNTQHKYRHTQNNARTVLFVLQNLGARFWDIPPLPPKCETSSSLRPNVAAKYWIIGSVLRGKVSGIFSGYP